MKKLLLLITVIAAAVAAKAQSDVSNLDFENWASGFPVGFYGSIIVQGSSGAEHGNSYAHVANSPNSSGAGFMFCTRQSGSVGVPYTQKPTSLSGYYRCLVANVGEKMLIGAKLSASAVTVGAGIDSTIVQSQSGWTFISIPINYISNTTPDSIVLLFSSNTTHAMSVSWLDVDNFALNFTTGIPALEHPDYTLHAYPNPATSAITIQTGNENARYISVFDYTGKLISTYPLKGDAAVINVNDYNNGVYSYVVTDANDGFIIYAKFIVAK